MAEKHLSDKTIETLFTVMSDVVFYDTGSWRDKRKQILAAASPADAANIEEFCSWFDKEES